MAVDGVVRVQVGRLVKTRAVAIRCERDRAFSNRFETRREDMRHVGEIGEIVVNTWLRESLPRLRVVWSKATSDVLTMPDFLCGRVRIDVKTVKRQGPFDYGRFQVGVTTAHVTADTDAFLFCSFNLASDELEILGGISRAALKRLGRVAEAGESVHGGYTIRDGHSVTVLQGSQIVLPTAFAQWIVAKDRDRDRPVLKWARVSL